MNKKLLIWLILVVILVVICSFSVYAQVNFGAPLANETEFWNLSTKTEETAGAIDVNGEYFCNKLFVNQTTYISRIGYYSRNSLNDDGNPTVKSTIYLNNGADLLGNNIADMGSMQYDETAATGADPGWVWVGNTTVKLNATVDYYACIECVTCDANNDVYPSVNNNIANGMIINGANYSYRTFDMVLYLQNMSAPPPPPASGDSLNITSTVPANGSSFGIEDMPVMFNVSFSSNQTAYCSLQLNGTVNQTKNSSTVGGVTLNFTKSLSPSGNWTYEFNCSNGANVTSSGLYGFLVDIDEPSMVTSFVNRSLYARNALNAHFNFSDNILLQQFNATIDGSLVGNQSNIWSTFYMWNLSRQITNLSSGVHNLTVTVTDGHTASELGGDYVWSNGLFNDYMRYEFWDGGEVRIDGVPGSLFDTFTTEREVDRYTFTYEPDVLQNSYEFEVESNHYITIVEKEGLYGGEWLIMGNHWMDFDLPNEPSSEVSITRINNNLVRVNVTGISNPEVQKYSSVGDLNIVSQTWEFYTVNLTANYSSTISELTTQSFSLDVSNASGFVNGSAANFIYMDDVKSLTKTSSGAFDSYVSSFESPAINDTSLVANFTWNYTVTGLVGSESGNISFNQTIVRIGIDNCSTYTQRAVNFTILRDDTAALVNGSIGGYFEVWVDDISSYHAFNLSWYNNVTHGLCIYPNDTAYNVYAQMEYYDTAGLFNTKTYYFTNATLTNVTNLVDLWLTPNGTLVQLTVTDQDDDAVVGAYISILKYDLTTDSFKINQIVKTDDDGQALATLVLNTQWYQFLIVYEGETVFLSTNPVIQTLTTRNFRINLIDNFLETYRELVDINTSLTYSNVTKNFVFTWNNPTGTSVEACLEVVNRGVGGDVLVNESCDTGASGTLIENSGDGAGLFVGTGTVQINPILTNILWVDHTEKAYQVFGKEGILMMFLVRLTLALAAIWNPIVAVVLLVLADMGMMVAGLYSFGWDTLLIYAVLAGVTIYRLRNK